MKKSTKYNTDAISFDDFMAHPEAQGPSGKLVSEMAKETLITGEAARKKERELKKARRIRKKQA